MAYFNDTYNNVIYRITNGIVDIDSRVSVNRYSVFRISHRSTELLYDECCGMGTTDDSVLSCEPLESDYRPCGQFGIEGLIENIRCPASYHIHSQGHIP